jgi:Holliday junction DNA helicase RuvA
MIGYLTGKILTQDDTTLLIDVNGVGYEVFVGSAREMKIGDVGEKVSVWVHTHVREDQLTLFGFREELQKRMFQVLIGINGIGPKLALSVLCQLSPVELVDAVTMGNTKMLRGVPGVGPKMADRMVLELKDKLGSVVKMHEWAGADQGSAAGTETWRELTEALAGLGFGDQQIRNVIRLLREELDGRTPEINELLKLALQKIKN